MLGKLTVPGRPTSLDDSRARAYCACSRCVWGGLDIFTLLCLFSSLSPSLWETTRYRLKYSLKGPLNPKEPTNQLEACYSAQLLPLYLYLSLDATGAVFISLVFSALILCRFCRDFLIGLLASSLPQLEHLCHRQTADW